MLAPLKKSLLLLLAALSATGAFAQGQLAFPTAEGYGKCTVGGRGGTVYEVTNLNDSGPGSLRAAVEAKGPRTVVFRVSGNIELKSNLGIKHPFITIAGQTAPGDGICIKGYPLTIGADEVIIRHIRVRFGDESGQDSDAISARFVKNLILDHVSASWSVDETMSIYHCENVTVQWCLIAESMFNSNHVKSMHGFGGIWGSNYSTYHHNLIAHHSSRNPRFASGAGFTDYRNNVLYNWGYRSSYGGEARQQGSDQFNSTTINMVANYYKPGPATDPAKKAELVDPSSRGEDDKGQWYVADNVVEGSPAVTADNWSGVRGNNYIKLDRPWDAMAIHPQTATEAFESVLQQAGATLPKRDAVDTRIIEETRTGTATFEGIYKTVKTVADSSKVVGIIDTQNDVGGWPELHSVAAPADSDHDGMPDDWEGRFGLDPQNAQDGAQDRDGDGYTNLEEYLNATDPTAPDGTSRPRIIVTSDGEIDDECSLVRFLLYTNEWDVEGIITSSSQYHWQGHKWAGDDWAQPYLQAYAEVYPNLIQHDARFPTPEFLQSRTLLGNVKAEGEMDEVTPGSQRIVEVLLDDSDPRPIWIQAWGGTNTIARALKTIEEQHPEKMAAVAAKIRFYFIWEQDETYQNYIRPQWGKFNIPTIISDQFIALFYHWKKYLPAHEQSYLVGSWMKAHVTENHGPLTALYKGHVAGEKGFDEGDFRSEGDSPAFFHTIPTGLRNLESPDWGGWGGRFVKVRDNTWLDPVAEPDYVYPEGRWFTSNAWGRTRLKQEIPNDAELIAYLKPQWRWIDVLQNDFAARADWCVKPHAEANHPPVVKLDHKLDLSGTPGERLQLSASGSTDPDGDALTYQWWQYGEADTYDGDVDLTTPTTAQTSFTVPSDAGDGDTIHIVCEVTDNGSPTLTRYQRVQVTVRKPSNP